jgi:hypothetical protein
MVNYFFDTSQYTEILQYVSLFLLFVIGSMLYFMSKSGDQMRNDIKNDIANLDLECPACPENKECPACPACPKCPDLKCSDGICPECPACPEGTGECPACPVAPEVSCPSVDDIVTGIFPGRNPGITNGGNFFDIQANESYELLSDYSFYDSTQAFPSDSILSASPNLVDNNIDIPATQLDNTDTSGENMMINTSPDNSLTRMNMASAGESTGASSNSQASMETGVPDSTNAVPTDPSNANPSLPDTQMP